MEQPSYFAVIPANVRYDKRLKPNAKLLYGEITSLTNKEGYCWADNSYFAELFEVSNETISRWISQLSEFGYIEVEIIQDLGNKRKITVDKIVSKTTKKGIDKKINTSCQNNQEVLTKKSIPLDKKVNALIMYNNKINNKINREETPLAFLKENSPTIYESLLMKYKRQIPDFDFAVEQAENKIVTEELNWTSEVINARFQTFFNNWIRNESKFRSNKSESIEPVLPQSTKI